MQEGTNFGLGVFSWPSFHSNVLDPILHMLILFNSVIHSSSTVYPPDWTHLFSHFNLCSFPAGENIRKRHRGKARSQKYWKTFENICVSEYNSEINYYCYNSCCASHWEFTKARDGSGWILIVSHSVMSYLSQAFPPSFLGGKCLVDLDYSTFFHCLSWYFPRWHWEPF